jgi:endonuclease/exonuclease/phosphatase family metal-dependent hydrolase
MSAETIKIASWNICNGLSNPAAMPAVVERIKGLEADIVALPEAFSTTETDSLSGSQVELLSEVQEKLKGAGYETLGTPYRDVDGRKDRHAFIMLHRREDAEMHRVDLGSRIVIGARIAELSLAVTGLHLDDRHEVSRLEQASNLVGSLNNNDHNVLMGDFNAMHRHDRRAQVLRLARPIAHLLPSVDPGEQAPNLAKFRRLGSLSQRLTEMATGATLDYLASEGYEDTDPQMRPTMGPVQLDHILSNFGNLHQGHYLSIGNHAVHEVPKTESDHHAISAVISY